jgi:diguanylate cyclase (GGDEF)-like protein
MNIDIKKIQDLQEFSKDLKVLYVEDNEQARKSTYETLNEFFNTIITAVDGEDGLKKFQNDNFDIVISDINMPNMNGIEMVQQIRKIDVNIPILIISAYSESGYFMETIRLGVEGYLLKPIELQQFISMISKTIEKIKLQQELEKYHDYLENTNIKLNDNLKEYIYKDQLTHLSNRFALEQKINTNKEKYLSICLIDINNFRKLNEMYGFKQGNEILVKMAKLLKENLTLNSQELFKVSADEFALLQYHDTYNLKIIYDTVNSIISNIDNKKIILDSDTEVIINITVGLSLDKNDVLTKASSALDLAKLKNKKYILFSEDNNKQEKLQELFHWQKEIKYSLDNDNIIPYFQAIYDKDKKIVKYEVLMRMKTNQNNQTKYISPFFFLDISIKTKQYDQLSYRIIQKALQIAGENKDKNFSINLGYRDMQNESVKNLITSYIQDSVKNGYPCNLIFEIVESEDIKDYNSVKEFFNNFQCTDIKIAIDDFGSGYSNFSHILEIMPAYLKIDGSLIKDINTNKNMLTLTKAIISFAKQLNIKTIAEFVHNDEIFNILKNEGVDEFQGFYLGEPKESL